MSSIAEVRERYELERRLTQHETGLTYRQLYGYAKTDRATLLAHLERCGGHEADCMVYCHTGPRKSCTCGWDQINGDK